MLVYAYVPRAALQQAQRHSPGIGRNVNIAGGLVWEHAANTVENPATGEHVKRVGILRAFYWLELGLKDIAHNPIQSISQGLILSAKGWLVIVLCSSQIELLALDVTGFMLIGPFFGAGFYALSRLRERGEKADSDQALDEALSNIGLLARLGSVLAVMVVAWAMISRLMFAQAFGSQPTEVQVSFYRTVVDWPHTGFVPSPTSRPAPFLRRLRSSYRQSPRR